MEEVVLSVSDFVAVLNQTLEYAYPNVSIVGELANFRISKNRWVYFDLKDEFSSVKFFGTVYNLPGPLEDGLMLQVLGAPRLHQQFGFSVNVQFIQPVGEGSIKKASNLLQAKLTAEGLFAPDRKRALPYPPQTVGLITSGQSAAYQDFVKILNARWGGVDVQLADVQVQGEPAAGQIVAAIEYFNTYSSPVDVLAIVRGGGSADDLVAFSTEQVVRAVAGSRIPTIVAIGHEVDISLAELAADQRASTPSNCAEMLVPDRRNELRALTTAKDTLVRGLEHFLQLQAQEVSQYVHRLSEFISMVIVASTKSLADQKRLVGVLNPVAVLRRGYTLVKGREGHYVKSAKQIRHEDRVSIEFSDGSVQADVV